ncbi:hypothetical protein HHK36_021078 [Tetracentron sinense]|uniref:Uncharacterized protein n=1 Tax=Tetracentron sinense TaxID=13715 RepID=A0A835DAB2_TETSI|nr:hypothetical protein HHK36_021078 [Tetracentron sinense]
MASSSSGNTRTRITPEVDQNTNRLTNSGPTAQVSTKVAYGLRIADAKDGSWTSLELRLHRRPGGLHHQHSTAKSQVKDVMDTTAHYLD